MKNVLVPSAIANIEYLSAPAASPDGKTFACVKTSADRTTGELVPRIQLIDSKNKTISHLNHSGQCKAPAWSPDGRYLAFLSNQSGEFQVWMQDLANRAFRQVTTMRHGVDRFVWSPDGSTIAFQGNAYKNETKNGLTFVEMAADEKEKWEQEKANAPVEITEIIYKYDGEGLLDGSMPCIGTSDIGSDHQRLLPFGFPCLMPAWSPDGKNLAFYARPYTGVKARRHELFVCNRDGSEAKQLTDGAIITAGNPPCFTCDGKSVIYDPWPELENGGTSQSLYKVRIDGGEPEELFCRNTDSYYGIYGYPVSRTFYGEENPHFVPSGDGKSIYFLLAWQGGEGIFKLSLEDKKVEPVVYGKFSVQSFCLTDEDDLLYIQGRPDQIGELYFQGERLTQSNKWLNVYEIAPVKELHVPTRDGEAEIQGWVMYPAGYKQGEKYPAVLDIRGGPETSSTADFWHEYQALAGAGFAVIYCNPRGSMGYGPAFNANGIAYDKALNDLLDFVDAAVELGFIDTNRIGVTGGSYGGYMTNKLISTTNRFAAAATQRTLCNTCTSYGTGDIGFVSARGSVAPNFKMLDFLTERARKSLICKVDDIKVPLLILHGYEDYRCSFEQSEQLFVAMKERNLEIPVRLVMFPGENHGITRTGKLTNQIRHLQEIVDWFKKYLVEVPRQGGAQHEQA